MSTKSKAAIANFELDLNNLLKKDKYIESVIKSSKKYRQMVDTLFALAVSPCNIKPSIENE